MLAYLAFPQTSAALMTIVIRPMYAAAIKHALARQGPRNATMKNGMNTHV
jgi:hypothetical protein